MCGQCGLVFGSSERKPEEREHLARIFTKLLILNEERGPFATGAALLNRDGSHNIHKQPVAASEFVRQGPYREILGSITDDATVLLGHTRWPTHGSLMNPANNHPLVAGRIWGTHNGMLSNASELFRHFGFPRTGQVDSEIIFRMADDTIRNGRIHVPDLLDYLSLCRGQMSAVMVTTTDPGTVLIAKGNKPLEFRYHRQYHAIAYASDPSYLDDALEEDLGWDEIPTEPMKLMVFRCDKLPRHVRKPFRLLGDLCQRRC